MVEIKSNANNYEKITGSLYNMPTLSFVMGTSLFDTSTTER